MSVHRSPSKPSLAREEVTRHDIAAFVDVVAASIGPEGRWIHFGLTSSDVLDTGFALQLRSAADLLLARLERLLWVVRRQALASRDMPIIGRSHGVHAEPTSFGHKLAVMAFELDRDRERLRRARETVSVGAISGVVGSYAAIDPRVEELVCARLGLRADEASTQVIQRDRHAEYMTTLAVVASTLDRIATEIRHLARTEVREVQEPFAEGQKGSSAMPHKRNPVVCERISGLARVVRGHAQAALENVALWHERDISHSSAERIIVPDATGLLDFMLADTAWVIDGLVVFPDRMLENVMSHGGIAFSQSALLALVEAGWSRDDAYRTVQRAAAAAWDEDASFREEIGSRRPGSVCAQRPGADGSVRPSARSCATWAGSSTPSRRCRCRRLRFRDARPVDCRRRARCVTSSTPALIRCSWSRPIASAPSTSCSRNPYPTRAGC